MVDRLDRVSRRYSLLINIDKTKVVASDGIACRIIIQNEQLAQVNTFPISRRLCKFTTDFQDFQEEKIIPVDFQEY